MNEKLITALLAILLALGGWTLSRTFSLSTDMVLIKEKVSSMEEKIDSFKGKKKKKGLRTQRNRKLKSLHPWNPRARKRHNNIIMNEKNKKGRDYLFPFLYDITIF